MLDSFPSLPNPSSCPMADRDPLIEDDYMSGDDGARPLMSRSRVAPVQLEWDMLHRDDLATLRAFRAAHRVTPFLWTDPFTGIIYEARFTGETPVQWKPLPKYPNRAKVSASILPVRPYTE